MTATNELAPLSACQHMTPFDLLIDQYFLSSHDKIKFIIGFFRTFRVLHIDASKINFELSARIDTELEFCDVNTRLKLIFFEIITQLNICGRLFEEKFRKNIPRFNEIRLFRNMCIEHYDDYMYLPGQMSFGFQINRKINGNFPCGEYGSGKNQFSKHSKIKNDLELAIQNLKLSIEQKKIDHLFLNRGTDEAKALIYFLLNKTSPNKGDDKREKNKKSDLKKAIWNFGLPSPFSDTDQYFQDEFLPFISDFLARKIKEDE